MMIVDEDVPLEEEPENRAAIKQVGMKNPRLSIFLLHICSDHYLPGYISCKNPTF